MARYTDAVCRLCRREGQKLFLKGDRCYTDKCALTRRAYAPGMHGQGRSKASEYGTQLREKQKAKRYYGVLETQYYLGDVDDCRVRVGDALVRVIAPGSKYRKLRDGEEVRLAVRDFMVFPEDGSLDEMLEIRT